MDLLVTAQMNSENKKTNPSLIKVEMKLIHLRGHFL